MSGDDPGPPSSLCAAGGVPSHSTASGSHTLPRSAPLVPPPVVLTPSSLLQCPRSSVTWWYYKYWLPFPLDCGPPESSGPTPSHPRESDLFRQHLYLCLFAIECVYIKLCVLKCIICMARGLWDVHTYDTIQLIQSGEMMWAASAYICEGRCHMTGTYIT